MPKNTTQEKTNKSLDKDLFAEIQKGLLFCTFDINRETYFTDLAVYYG